MHTIFTYIYFGLYMFISLFYALKLKYLKKHSTKEAAEEYLNNLVGNWSRNVLKKVGVKVKVIGIENLPEGNCLFVSNHQGNFDVLVMIASINKPMGFIAKKETLKLKLIAFWMKEIHCVFIDRNNARESVKAINEGIENLRKGYSMVIFPEGTRSKGHNINEFKKGSLKLGTKVDIPIVPLTIDGTYKIFEENNGKKLIPSEVTLLIDKPIYAKDFSTEEQKNLSQTIQNIISNNLSKL